MSCIPDCVLVASIVSCFFESESSGPISHICICARVGAELMSSVIKKFHIDASLLLMRGECTVACIVRPFQWLFVHEVDHCVAF